MVDYARTEFTPLDSMDRTDQLIEISDGIKLELMYWNKPDSEILAATNNLIQTAYRFLISEMNFDFAQLPHRLVLQFKPNGSFLFDGILLLIPIFEVQLAIQTGDGSFENSKVKSLFIHELIHSFVFEEELPMFLELIYMVKSCGGARMIDLFELIDNQKIGIPHLEGLQKIADYLGYQTPLELLKDFASLNLDWLKEKFKQRAEVVIRENADL